MRLRAIRIRRDVWLSVPNTVSDRWLERMERYHDCWLRLDKKRSWAWKDSDFVVFNAVYPWTTQVDTSVLDASPDSFLEAVSNHVRG